LELSTAGYYRSKTAQDRSPLRREVRQADLDATIVSLHKGSNGAYGATPVTLDLVEVGESVSHNSLAVRMVGLGIVGISPRIPSSPRPPISS
jgi:putative transposase